MNKTELRRAIRERRRAVSVDEARASAHRLLRLVMSHRLLLRARRIGFYLPMAEEIDLLPLVNAALCDGSVKAFTNDVDPAVWRALSTRAGGEAKTR
jgi:5-formyltetrahydrofolate cyclo-ligase